ncbi:DUF58 domain-containing protein [Hyalangium gracile]|uniref:DUF58 domain-containing protein n=1 Tax=Hyalangium gracile TaxID=394092 RepID=UPI001CCEF65E|nr:DUF58 domain-containing protein [Hyalangium gracile]
MAGESGILTRVRALELVAQRNVSSLYSGNYVTTVRGSGMEFNEARHYSEGDPERHIDWNMTARLDEPFVRTYLEEREREVIVAVDVSASMHSGWQERSKLETAMELAATLGLSAIEAGDRLGFLTFHERVVDFSRPLGGRRQLYTFLRALAGQQQAPPPRTRVSDPRAAIHAIQSLRGRRFVVFLISDFIDHDVPDDLRFIGQRHDVSLVHVYDPFEYAGPGPVRLLAMAPEGPTQARSVPPDASGSLEAMQRFLAEAGARHGLLTVSVSTQAPVGRTLSDFFHRKQQWIR